jgi:hypothetical protein
MSEILIKLSDDVSKDPIGSWRTGDIFTAREDGFKWGTEEVPPIFLVVKLPGIPLSQLQPMLVGWNNVDGDIYRQRLWMWDGEKFVRKSDGIIRTVGQLQA